MEITGVSGSVLRGNQHTLLLSSSSTHSMAAALKTKLSYDPEKDFAPIIELVYAGSALLVSDTLPVRTAPELVAYMKQRGDDNTFGSADIGTIAHLSAEDFKLSTDVQLPMFRTRALYWPFRISRPAS